MLLFCSDNMSNCNFKVLEAIKYIKKHGAPMSLLKRLDAETSIQELVHATSSNVGLDSPCMQKFKRERHVYLTFMDCPEVEEGMFTCSACGSKKIYTTSKQTRSGDEATTVFAQCTQCKKGWVVN
ncbi:hypothetical protein AV955_gp082 [Diadromus pulchellus ascovirus 4a]|uniref:Complete DpAV4 genome n=1 Tax=Diadromus pulchellus ascovirus 4a TaxID=158683 RepID=F2NZ11_9VIRU|nr:hypothetical protein AV955_gp082 [Diadromus pulchellus ascovirus 4a]CCA61439.1 unnamed protein product [Diadromus pulchellus ascovirus 4a]